MCAGGRRLGQRHGRQILVAARRVNERTAQIVRVRGEPLRLLTRAHANSARHALDHHTDGLAAHVDVNRLDRPHQSPRTRH